MILSPSYLKTYQGIVDSSHLARKGTRVPRRQANRSGREICRAIARSRQPTCRFCIHPGQALQLKIYLIIHFFDLFYQNTGTCCMHHSLTKSQTERVLLIAPFLSSFPISIQNWVDLFTTRTVMKSKFLPNFGLVNEFCAHIHFLLEE